MTFDEVLRQMRAELTARLGTGGERAEAIRAALDAYLSAHAAAVAAEFAARNGLAFEGDAAEADVVAAAVALRELVASLPELSSPAGAEAPTSAATPPSPERSGERFQTMDIPTLEEAERRLAAEFDAAPFAGMRLGEFLLYAEEFAAAARALQERTGGDPLSQRVIRRLTILVHERELAKKVFGLSRSHTGDWQRLANEARARRLAAKRQGDDVA